MGNIGILEVGIVVVMLLYKIFVSIYI